MRISETENLEQNGEIVDTQDSKDLPSTTEKWVIMFDKKPSVEDDRFINHEIEYCTNEKCENNCIAAKRIMGKSSLVELWEFEGTKPNIQTHSERITSGVRSTSTHAEVNYVIEFREDKPFRPDDESFQLDLKAYDFPFSGIKPDKNNSPIKIAVLDTGIDTEFFPKEFLWRENGIYGKRFIENGGTAIEDDDVNRHGTLVSSLILNQFKDNPVQIMNLKTHNAEGEGDLFAIMDAICFAKEQKVDIINASWGFYDNEDIENSFLKTLINKTLKDSGILFVTASGNKNNGSGHHFFPAGFGKDIKDEEKNLIVVTTINKENNEVSTTQNAAPDLVVDFGVPADTTEVVSTKVGDKVVDIKYFKYTLPFTQREQPDAKSNGTVSVSGSSFAAAIASGLIGNFLGKPNKKSLLDRMGGHDLFGQDESLNDKINEGRFLRRNHPPKSLI